MPGVAPYPRPDPAWLAEQYGSGRTQADLAAELGVSPGTVRAWLLAAGVQLRPRGRPSRIRREELEGLVASGATVRELATHYGLSSSAVLHALHRDGLESAIARYDAGETAPRIAEALGVNRRTVRFWITKCRQPPPSTLHAEPLREALRAGAEVRDLAEEAGVSLSVAYRAIEFAHASRLLRRRPVDPAEVRQGLAEGRSIVELAAERNTTPAAIRSVARS